MKSARISEIFESVQGEGPYAGERQVFVRFFGCGLGCGFCDTSLAAFREYSVERLRRELGTFQGHHSVSLTGGEPLIQVDFLEEFLRESRPDGLRYYLETNGVDSQALARVICGIDIVAMDFKLSSSTGLGPLWQEHEEFLRVAGARDVFVKMVIGDRTSEEDIAQAAEVIGRVDPATPVVLQPDWFHRDPGLLDRMIAFKQRLAAEGLIDVRIMPQLHKLAGVK